MKVVWRLLHLKESWQANIMESIPSQIIHSELIIHKGDYNLAFKIDPFLLLIWAWHVPLK